MNVTNPLLLGVDLGGTKIEGVLMQSGRTLLTRRVATPVGDYGETVRRVRDLCTELETAAGLAEPLPLGIGTPGSPSPADQLMRNCNSTALNQRCLLEDLQHATGRAVRLANDADCFTLSEAVDGAGCDAGTVFGVILGTGVGGGVCIDGKLLTGPNGTAGEWGHNRLALERLRELPDLLCGPRLCYCGRTDCVETWLSGPGLARTHELLHGSAVHIRRLHDGNSDAAHDATLGLYAEMLAVALAGIINVLDPDIIVLGGGLSNIDALYTLVPAMLPGLVFSDVCRTPVHPAVHGDSSGVRGAAWLWKQS